MAEFKKISIKNKLILIQSPIAFIAAVICSAFFLYNDIQTSKSSAIRNKKSLAEIVGVNLITPLLSNDQDAANKIVSHLDSNPTILNAVVFDKNGKKFAEHFEKDEALFSFPTPTEKPLIKQRFWESQFILSDQIFKEKEFLGTIMLRAELNDLATINYNYLKTAVLFLIFSVFSAFIIARFRQAKKLQLSLSLMRATIESTTDGILVVDKEGKISVLNEQFKKMWKIPDAILNTRDDNKALAYVITQIKYPEKFLNNVNKLYANPTLESFDVIEKQDGTTFERYSKPQRNNREEIVGRVWSFRDVTIRNRALEELRTLNEQLEDRVKQRTLDLTKTQESLQRSEEKYRKLVEEAGDVVYTTNHQGNFTYINPMCTTLTGYTANELVGKPFLDLIDPEWKQKVAKFYKEQFDNKIQETTFSFPISTKSGEKKWVEQIVVQQKVGDKVIGHQAIVRDVTERKKSEAEIQQKSEVEFLLKSGQKS